MNNERPKRNRFRKLVPTSNPPHHKDHLSRLLTQHSRQPLHPSASPGALHPNIKMRTISSVEEGAHSRHTASQLTLKRHRQLVLDNFNQKREREKMKKLLALGSEFRRRVEGVLEMGRESDREGQAEDEQWWQLCEETKLSAGRLIGAYLKRILRRSLERGWEEVRREESEKGSERGQGYLSGSILPICPPSEGRPGVREKLLNVERFLSSK